MKTFLSDNASGVHPKIIDAIVKCNKEHMVPYGNDAYTAKAIEKFREVFGKEVDVYFVQNGTGANVIGLSSILRPFEGVVCPNTAHINVDECGALERFSGSKILYVDNRNGKICPDDVKKFLHAIDNEHESQPRVISISQTTEMGTVYTVQEIKELADFAHKNNMLLHVDGSRISNAAVYLNVTFKEMISDTNVDLISFGGTKNGMMYGEAIVCLNNDISKYLKFIRKQGMQLISKMRYISAQFLAYFENELWKENANHANNMAKILERELRKFPQIDIVSEVQSNIIFVKLPENWIKALEEHDYFYVIDADDNIIRMVTSFDTEMEEIEEFINKIKQLK